MTSFLNTLMSVSSAPLKEKNTSSIIADKDKGIEDNNEPFSTHQQLSFLTLAMSETLVRATIISSVSFTMVNESRIKAGRCPWKDPVPTPPGGHARTHNLVTPGSKWSSTSCHFPPLVPVSLFHSFRNLFFSLFFSSGKKRKIALRKGVKRARGTSANFKAVEFDVGDDGLTSSPSPLPTCYFAGFAEMRECMKLELRTKHFIISFPFTRRRSGTHWRGREVEG